MQIHSAQESIHNLAEIGIEDYALSAPLEIGELGKTYIASKQKHKYVLKYIDLVGEQNQTTRFQNMFLHECKTLSNLYRRGLPKIAGFSTQGSQLLLLLDFYQTDSLLEFVYPEARNFKSLIGKQVLPDWERVVRWATQLGRILAYLHEQQPFPVIYRGLNPLTVRITKPAEDIELIDWGLLNSFYTASLSHQYVAPIVLNPFIESEILNKFWADPYVDIYAFGRILDFMLTGFVPTQPGAPPVFPTALNRPTLNHELSTLLTEIITRCCGISLSNRYSSMSDVLENLAYLSNEPLASNAERITCSCGQSNRLSARFCERCGSLLHIQQAQNLREARADSTPITISYEQESHVKLLESYNQNHWGSLQRFQLREVLDTVQSDPGFDELVSLDSLPLVTKLPHQKEAALIVLKKMRGRALLADEVGLGKTVEAGIILKELLLRQLVSKVLIFCPIQLLSQWQSELYEKFDEVFLVMGKDIDTSLAWHCSRLIAPYEIARHRFHLEEMLHHEYDLLIFDEAHCLNYPENERILRAMKNLRKKYFLLLSATPMHNSLDELYNIITLLRPGHFDDLKRFREQFVDPDNQTQPRNTELLRKYLHDVMVRNSRRQVIIEHPFPVREATTVALDLVPAAVDFYTEFREFYKKSVQEVNNPRFLLRLAEIVERLCSSPEAFQEPINQLKKDRYIQKQLGGNFIRQLERFAARYPDELIEPKIQATLEALRELTNQGQKILVFSQFNETARYVHRRIRETDLRKHCFLYDESLPIEAKLQRLSQFRDAHAGILFCPGEASEGLNLQFASVMINFDIPWDPMKLEQRIGRIQRIGGKQKIIIINLILRNTIEEDILRICQDKIGMFEQVVGKVEEILGNLREEDDIRKMICDIYTDSNKEDEDGQLIGPTEYIDLVLDIAVEKSSVEEEANTLNQIYFDFSEADT
ncbi:MAG: SNF2-related protein [Caldilineaceae bacterium]